MTICRLISALYSIPKAIAVYSSRSCSDLFSSRSGAGPASSLPGQLLKNSANAIMLFEESAKWHPAPCSSLQRQETHSFRNWYGSSVRREERWWWLAERRWPCEWPPQDGGPL